MVALITSMMCSMEFRSAEDEKDLDCVESLLKRSDVGIGSFAGSAGFQSPSISRHTDYES